MLAVCTVAEVDPTRELVRSSPDLSQPLRAAEKEERVAPPLLRAPSCAKAFILRWTLWRNCERSASGVHRLRDTPIGVVPWSRPLERAAGPSIEEVCQPLRPGSGDGFGSLVRTCGCAGWAGFC